MNGEKRDDLTTLIDEFSAEHPWLRRRALLSDWWDRQVGRWLPWLCQHHAAAGPIRGPLRCMDCGKDGV